MTRILIVLLAGCIQDPALWITKSGNGRGDIVSSPGGIDCGTTCAMIVKQGVDVELTAMPLADTDFAGWSGGDCTGTATCILRLTDDTTIDARFDLKPTP